MSSYKNLKLKFINFAALIWRRSALPITLSLLVSGCSGETPLKLGDPGPHILMKKLSLKGADPVEWLPGTAVEVVAASLCERAPKAKQCCLLLPDGATAIAPLRKLALDGMVTLEPEVKLYRKDHITSGAAKGVTRLTKNTAAFILEISPQKRWLKVTGQSGNRKFSGWVLADDGLLRNRELFLREIKKERDPPRTPRNNTPGDHPVKNENDDAQLAPAG